jgi:DNA-binding transcriptional regulator GbsR (MarR family)
MQDELWHFVDSVGEWASRANGLPPVTGRVLAWLLVCDPPEQTAAELADALGASAGSISAATRMLVGGRMVDRLRVRGERADRFRLRPDMWDEQIMDPGTAQIRTLIARGLAALADEPPERRQRLEDLDEFYAWYQARAPRLVEEWHEYRRSKEQATTKKKGGRRAD